MNRKSGFTIIELLVVIVIISILATITVAGYGAWRDRAAKTEVVSDLRNAALAMNNYRNFNNEYPASLAAAAFKASPNVTVTMPQATTTDFCVQAVSKVKTSVAYYINSSDKKNPTVGSCPASIGPNIPVLTPGQTGYLEWNGYVYVTVSPPSGPAVTSYSVYYRNNSSSGWSLVSPTGASVSSGTTTIYFDQTNTLTTSYLSNQSTGALRLIANGSGGTTSAPLDVPYANVEYWGM